MYPERGSDEFKDGVCKKKKLQQTNLLGTNVNIQKLESVQRRVTRF